MNLSVLLRELWQSWRASLRRPGFVLLAGLTLALGVGFAAAFINLMRTLDPPINAVHAQDLFLLSPATSFGAYSPVQERDYRVLRTLPGPISTGVISSAYNDVNFGAGGRPMLASAAHVSRGYLLTLGIRMAQGRYFSRAEDQPHGPPAVILTHGFWQRHFAGQQVVGRSVQINGRSMPIVGVLSANFPSLGPGADIVLPLQLDTAKGSTHNLVPLIRLRAGIHPAQVAALATARINALRQQRSGTHPLRHRYRAVPLAKVKGIPRGIVVLMVAALAGLLLVLAGNVSNLMLIRLQQRQQQLAVRTALGASGKHMLLDIYGESLLVMLLGSAAALVVGDLASHALQVIVDSAASGGVMPRFGSWVTQLPVVIGLVLLVVLLSNAAASWRTRRMRSALRALHGADSGQDRGASRTIHLLLIVQTTLAAALIGISLLLATAAYRADASHSGYDAHDVYQFHLALPKSLYPDVHDRLQLLHAVNARLRALPGVESAGASATPWFNFVMLTGATLAGGHTITVATRYFSGDYAQALHVPLLQGRSLRDADRSGAPVLWVNQAFVQRYLKGRPLGQRITVGNGKTGISFEIAGVIGNTFTAFSPSEPLLWLPTTATTAKAGDPGYLSPSFIVRVRPGLTLSAAAVAAAVHADAPLMAIAHLRALANDAPFSTLVLTLLAKIVAVLALATLLLAAVCLFAISSVAATARLREFGIRLAMGATPMRLLWLVLRGALLRTLIGLLLGTVLTVLLGLLARSLLLQLDSTWLQPWGLALTWCVLLATGVLAALPSALRAARTPPHVVLNESAS